MKGNRDWIVTASRVFLILIIFMIAILAMECHAAKAAVITGDRPLAGASWLMQQVIEKNGSLYDHEELDLLSEVIYWENYCNGYEVMLYTGSVVLNRMKSPNWPNTMKDVLYQKGQYATVKKFFTKEIPEECRQIALHLLLCGSQAPDNVIYQSTHKEFGSGVWKVIKGEYFNYE